MRLPISLLLCAVLSGMSPTPGRAASSSPQPSIEYCLDLYGLWIRYEWHSTFHNSQKARANLALESDCLKGRSANGATVLEGLLQRGRVPLPRRQLR